MLHIILNFTTIGRYIHRSASYALRFIRLTLNLEISDNCKQLKFLISNIFRLTRTIQNNLPIYICNQFFNTQQWSLRKLSKKEKIRMNKKLKLCSSNNSNINTSNIKKINYIEHTYSDKIIISHNDVAVSFHGSCNLPNAGLNNVFSVDLDSSEYICRRQALQASCWNLARNGLSTLLIVTFLMR